MKIAKDDIQNICKLTPLQEGMLFHSLLDPTSTVYLERTRYHLSGRFNLAAFRFTWERLIDRHEVLRALFLHKNTPDPVQVILKHRAFSFDFHDLSSLSLPERQARVAECFAATSSQVFDLSRDPLMRFHIFRHSDESHEVVWVYHHILFDGWSLGVLLTEFWEIYQARVAGRNPQLALPVSFSIYLKWLRSRSEKASMAYWKERLRAPLPQAAWQPAKRSAAGAFERRLEEFSVSEAQFSSLRAFSMENRVSLNAVLHAGWTLALQEVFGVRDMIFGETVSGRPPEISGVERMVGLLINAIPVRVTLQEGETYKELVQRIHQEAVEAEPYHYGALSEIQAIAGVNGELFDHILVFENYPDSEDESSEDSERLLRVDRFEHEDHTNYPLTVQFVPAKRLTVRLIYDGGVFSRQWMVQISGAFTSALERIISRNDQLIDVSSKSGENDESDRDGALAVVVSATFTVDPILPYLEWVQDLFSSQMAVAIAPFHQVCQELLNPESETSKNTGLNVLMVRWGDYLIELPSPTGVPERAILNQALADLKEAVRGRLSRGGLWVILFPIADRAPAYVAEAQEAWRAFVDQEVDIELLDWTQLDRDYGVHEVFDLHSERIGRVPFTEEWFAAAGTRLVRRIRAWQRSDIKVIAVDCDQTLWAGVCGEVGSRGVKIEESHLALQELLVKKAAEGFLIVLVSKNQVADVMAVFDQHPDMRLKRSHLAGSRVNWLSKSENLRSLATELNLGLDSFVFVDDSPLECEEVATHLPDVLVIRVPDDHISDPRRYYSHLWCLDRYRITEEDRRRVEMVQAEKARERERQSERFQNRDVRRDLAGFLKSLEVSVQLSPIADHQWERAAQLTQRTNQFNFTTIRMTESELRGFAAQDGAVVFVVRVRDRFGDYGVSGIICGILTGNALRLDQFLLSCRVLGRDVEGAILKGLRESVAADAGMKVQVRCRQTDRNKPAFDFLERSGWALGELVEGRIDCSITGDVIDRLGVESHYVVTEVAEPPTAENDKASSELNLDSSSLSADHDSGDRVLDWSGWNGFPHGTSLRNRAYGEVLRLAHGSALVAAVHSQEQSLGGGREFSRKEGGQKQRVSRPYSAPETETEKALVTIWQELLNGQSIGVDDDFFELGGHSLKATRLVSRIHRALNREVDLAAVFSDRTIRCLASRIDQKSSAWEPIPKVAVSRTYPLSHAQRRMWALHQLESDSIAYNSTGFYWVDGSLDVNRFREAVFLIISKHEILRSVFQEVEWDVNMVVRNPDESQVEVVEFEREDSQESTAALQQFAARLIESSFRLDVGPLFVVKIVRGAEERFLVALHMHHIVSDGISLDLFQREVMACYDQALDGPLQQEQSVDSREIRYTDYAAWQEQWITGAAGRACRDFWTNKLKDLPPALPLPTDRSRLPVQTFRGDSIQFRLNEGCWSDIVRLSTGEGGTPFSAFVTLVKLLLFRHTHQPDIVVGTVTSGRDHPDLENVIGLIANTVALRSQVEGVSSFVEILGQVARVCQEAFSNQGYPFDLVLDSLGLERDLSRSALFDVMITYQGRESTASPASLSFEEWECDSPLSRFDLTFNALETETGLIVTAVFNVDLFDRRRIEQMGKRFVMLAESVRSAPKESLAQLEFLPADERAWLHEKFFPAKVPFRSNRTLPQLFDEVVSHYPMAPALKADSLLLSYRELANEAEHIANLVLTQEGKGRSGVVGVLMRSRSHAVVAMLGVLKAGCVYLPIDSSYPADRIEHLLQDSNACALITDFEPDAVSAWAVRLGVIFWGKEVPLDVEGHSDSSLSRAEPKATDPAYLIYTSGSTGMPKGVMVSHRGFVNMIFQQIETFDVKPGDRVVLFSSLSFDASLSEMFMSLLAGAVLCCPSRDVILDGVQFLDYLREEKIDVATLPPQFLRALSQPDLSSLKTVITAGEAAFSQDVQFYAKTGRLRYVNAYGPTECSVCATMYVVPKEWSGDHVPIGRPLDNLGIGLIDTDGRLAPVGHPGEICLRGVGLAEGYWNRPDLKAECFPARPELGTGTERVYFTGDIGVWTEEGDLLFVGRADEQLKIRGHRVEPGEIEKALSRYHGVSECCVIGDRSALGGIRLVAFYSGVATPSELGAVLRQQLPAYLVPSRFISMKALPVTSSGKVDRAALVVLEEPMAKPGPLGTTREEEILLKILGDVLGRHAFELTDSFFELGGDSIQAIEVIQHLAREGYQVEVRDLVLNPTVQELALVLRSVARPDGDKPPNRVTASEAIPLTPIQSWFFSVFGAERDHFNHSDMIFSEAHFDEQAVKAAVEEVWKDHDQLRAQFRPGEGVGRSTDSWLQVVPENAAAPIWRCSDLRGEEEWETHLLKQANELQTGLSLQEGPLLGVCLFQCTDGDRLLFVIHHLVIDGVSWRILLDDFLAAYRRIVGEGVKPQCGKGASFADWSMALQNLVSDGHFLGQRNYWEGVLNGEVDTLPLKAASAGRVRSVQAHFSLMLSHEDTALLSERVKRGSLLGDWILAGVGLALCRWSGANRFLVANESHGRHVLKEMPALDVARTVGWFTNVFPVRLEIDSSEPLEVNAVRLTTSRLAVPDFGLGYGVLRYLSQDSEKLVARASPQMSFNYLGRYGNTDLDGLRVGGDLDGEAVSPKARVIYDLEWNAIILNGELRVVLGVAEGALNPADVETIMDGLRETLLTVPKGAKDESGNESSGASKVT